MTVGCPTVGVSLALEVNLLTIETNWFGVFPPMVEDMGELEVDLVFKTRGVGMEG